MPTLINYETKYSNCAKIKGLITIPKDKQKHLLTGLPLSLLAGFFVYPTWGLATAVVVGALKEIIWDWWLKRGTPEWWDFWATCLGGTAGFAILTMWKGW